jgi:hypothetical protein
LGRGVCQGYAEAFGLLCHLAGIDCITVKGKSYSYGNWEGHVWNIVKIDDYYYHLDTTFDDPVMQGGQNVLNYHYFNLTDDIISSDHEWEKEEYPQCSSVKHNYYYMNNLVVENREELASRVQEVIKAKQTETEIMIRDFSPDSYADISDTIFDIIFKTGTVKTYWSSINEKIGIIRIFGIEY